MRDLTKIEETILLAIFRLKDNAYGITVRDQIKRATKREYIYSSLYTTLEQLVKKEYIEKRFGNPSPQRGGKRKIYFNLTEAGISELKNTYLRQKSVWNGITEKTLRKEYLK